MGNTNSNLPVKGIDYFSEEYVKQVVQNGTDKKLDQLLPFIGSIAYPSENFPDRLDNDTERQFKDTIFVGFLELLLPDLSIVGDPAFTAISFKLDGIERHFVVVSGSTETISI